MLLLFILRTGSTGSYARVGERHSFYLACEKMRISLAKWGCIFTFNRNLMRIRGKIRSSDEDVSYLLAGIFKEQR